MLSVYSVIIGVYSVMLSVYSVMLSVYSVSHTDIVFWQVIFLPILRNPTVEIGDMMTEHNVLHDCGIVILSAVNQRLDIFPLVFFSYNRRNKPQLSLNHIHYKSGRPAIAVNPRMNGYQTEMSFETQTITCCYISSVRSGKFFIEPSTEIINCACNLIVCQITSATDTGTDIAEAQLTFRGIETPRYSGVLAPGSPHNQSRQLLQQPRRIHWILRGCPERIKISVLQVDVHHLLRQRAPISGNTLIEKKLIFHFSDCRSLYRRRMGHDGIEIELLIVHLILDSRSKIILQSFFYLYVKILVHHYIYNM